MDIIFNKKNRNYDNVIQNDKIIYDYIKNQTATK